MLRNEQFAKTLLDAGAAPSLIGTLIGDRYRVERLLGEGGMGAVYLVEHVGLRKHFALKLLRSELVALPGVLSRFELEARIVARLDHPNVANASDYGCTDDGRLYLVLEYVEGQELRQVLDDEQGPLPLSRALFIVRQIASALGRAHDLGIVHRDLKPENIMLVQREGHGDFVKVLDFGLAQVSRRLTGEVLVAPRGEARGTPGHKQTTVGDVAGTPAYMAPEQSVGESTDGRADLYALGVMLYELLSGRRPFLATSVLELIQQHISTPPPPISESAPAVKLPPEVEELVRRLLAKKPEERIQRAQDLIAQIDRIVAAHKLVWPESAAWPESLIHSEPTLGQHISSGDRTSSISPLPKLTGGRRQQLPLILSGALCLATLSLVFALRFSLQPAPPSAAVLRPGMAPPSLSVLTSNVAPQSAYEMAAAQGLSAMETLASRYPSDLRVQRALLRIYNTRSQHGEAMRLIAKMAAQDPSATRDPEIVNSISAAAQGEEESVQAVLTLLEQDLGAAGPELLYELSGKQTSAGLRSRFHQSLSKPEVLAKASPATRIAVELRAAKRCEQKRALLRRAGEDGDRRTLVQLKSLTRTSGCGFLGLRDCWPCLRKGRALRVAITALDARY